jgi:hypothetical protein
MRRALSLAKFANVFVNATELERVVNCDTVKQRNVKKNQELEVDIYFLHFMNESKGLFGLWLNMPHFA